MDLALVVAVEILYAIATLALISAGLAIVFGLMRVINLAHGEFLTIGGYTAIVASKAGANIYLAMLVLAPLAAGAIGLIVERLVIRRLYGRLIDTMLATWGLSLLFIGGMSMIFGTTTTGISAPIGGLTVGNYQIAGYGLFVIAVAAIMMLAIGLTLSYSRLGLTIRGAMQNVRMAAAFGCNAGRMYMITFAAGTALTGLAGGVLAPLVGVVPNAGAQYIGKAFITVIGGGPAIVAGTLSGATVFGLVDQAFTYLLTVNAGEVALLLAAVVLLRLLPRGITGRFFRRSS